MLRVIQENRDSFYVNEIVFDEDSEVVDNYPVEYIPQKFSAFVKEGIRDNYFTGFADVDSDVYSASFTPLGIRFDFSDIDRVIADPDFDIGEAIVHAPGLYA